MTQFSWAQAKGGQLAQDDESEEVEDSGISGSFRTKTSQPKAPSSLSLLKPKASIQKAPKETETPTLSAYKKPEQPTGVKTITEAEFLAKIQGLQAQGVPINYQPQPAGSQNPQ